MEKGRTLRNVLLLEKKRKIGGGIGDNTNHMLKNPFVKRYYTNSC